MGKLLKEVEKSVDLSLIDEPDGILRIDIDQEELTELAQSIKEIGLLQRILLARKGERFEIVFGHRRYLAHVKAGIPKIRSIIRTMTREEIAIARATENISRKDLTPIEEAATYNDLKKKYGMSLEDIGKKMGKSPGIVKRRIDMLRMPPQLQEALHKGRISIAVAEELWPISNLVQLDYYLSFALDGGCTKDVARQWCKDWKDSQRRQPGAIEGGGEPMSPYEPRPTFLPCDLCQGPVELGHDKIMRACPKCYQQVINALKGVKQ